MGVLAELFAEGAERLDHVVFHGAGGNTEPPGDFFMLDAFLPAEEVNGFLAGRELLDGFVEDFPGFLECDVGLRGAVGGEVAGGYLLPHHFFPGHFPEAVDGVILGHAEQVAAKGVHFPEGFPVFPKLQEYVLHHVFRRVRGTGQLADKPVQFELISVEKMGKCQFIPICSHAQPFLLVLN